MPGDIILHKYTKNHDQLMYSSWGMVCSSEMERQMDGRMDGKSEAGTPP